MRTIQDAVDMKATSNRFSDLFDRQKAYFNTNITKSYEWRIEQLDRLSRMLSENMGALSEAVGSDFYGFAIIALEVHRLRTVVSPTPGLLISAKRALRRFASLGARSLRT